MIKKFIYSKQKMMNYRDKGHFLFISLYAPRKESGKNALLNNSVITLIIYSFNKYYISAMANLLHVGEGREYKDKKIIF